MIFQKIIDSEIIKILTIKNNSNIKSLTEFKKLECQNNINLIPAK